MIYVTGDTHGEQICFIEGNMTDEDWTEKDFLIIAGDFGYIFFDDAEENRFLDYLEREKPYTILFLDGNHENFPAIYAYPEEDWHGGKIHRIRKNIIHLMRGQIYSIEGKTFFTFGGAFSIDRSRRKLNRSYWDEELPSTEEYETARRNLDGVKRVDYIITHTAPNSVIEEIGCTPFKREGDAELTEFFENEIKRKLEFNKWFFGHWHIDRELDGGKFTAVFKNIRKIG